MVRMTFVFLNTMFLCVGLFAGAGYHYMIKEAKQEAQMELLMQLPLSALIEIPTTDKVFKAL